MPKTLTETSSFDATMSIPQDGDPLVINTGGSGRPLEDPLQKLTNRTKYLFDQIPNGYVRGGCLRAPLDTNIYIAPVEILVGGVLISKTTEATLAVGTVTNNTWYYVYGYNNSGNLGVELSSTAPDAALRFKTSDSTRVYLGAVRSISTTEVRPFRMSTRGAYLVRWSVTNTTPFVALTAGNATSFTDVSLTSHLPPHGRLARVLAVVTTAGTSDDAFIRTNGDTTNNHAIGGSSIANILRQRELEIETDSGQVIEYKVGNSASALDLYVTGWQEGV